jgi:hypothetical protein
MATKVNLLHTKNAIHLQNPSRSKRALYGNLMHGKLGCNKNAHISIERKLLPHFSRFFFLLLDNWCLQYWLLAWMKRCVFLPSHDPLLHLTTCVALMGCTSYMGRVWRHFTSPCLHTYIWHIPFGGWWMGFGYMGCISWTISWWHWE